mmetsp:Transcript_38941/g.63100  ORF Transcript_38941/g.63100 Transcript_38941/m.63100 type:complete len:206 (-) Transcript_38941:442-1059(-)|eukprot:CAMPEP_0184658320 /NCGR_PEP_ID=MMETSP0308-20130426/24958_1 /TAXON_ID=38269 /ORGANISM="Gloeochaete witrockiana, Strain SAG 46.84" /LENGTH=205 /DNA_ID=CAMNT_0027097233 /DNA_START=24 /DNA_END=641 /DNA_ORIENTATION=+
MPIRTTRSLDAFLRVLQKPGRRLLGLDVGDKNVGVAVSDLVWSAATPVSVIRLGPRRVGKKLSSDEMKEHQSSEVHRFMKEQDAAGLVVGFPLLPSGEEGLQCLKVRLFVEDLKAHLLRQQYPHSTPCLFWDERWSSHSLQIEMFEKEGKDWEDRKSFVKDMLEASSILDEVLDAMRRKLRERDGDTVVEDAASASSDATLGKSS